MPQVNHSKMTSGADETSTTANMELMNPREPNFQDSGDPEGSGQLWAPCWKSIQSLPSQPVVFFSVMLVERNPCPDGFALVDPEKSGKKNQFDLVELAAQIQKVRTFIPVVLSHLPWRRCTLSHFNTCPDSEVPLWLGSNLSLLDCSVLNGLTIHILHLHIQFQVCFEDGRISMPSFCQHKHSDARVRIKWQAPFLVKCYCRTLRHYLIQIM